MLHVIFSIMGSYTIFLEYPTIFQFIKMAGVIYIMWLAYKLLKPIIYNYFILKEYIKTSNIKLNNKYALGNSYLSTFFNGFFVDLFNPYITIFYFSLFSQIISNNISNFSLLIYITIVFLLTITWFTLVAILFAQDIIKRNFYRYKNIIEGCSGLFLIYFAVRLYLC